MNTKERNNKLMGLADKAIQATDTLFKDKNKLQIHDSFNGQIAALSVSIAMSGLKPALAIYFQDNKKTKVDRRTILEVIAKMIYADNDRNLGNVSNDDFSSAESLFRYAIKLNDGDLKKLQREVIDCAIALKQVVRTYNLV